MSQQPVNPLLKEIAVAIDRTSWNGPYTFPAEFAQTSSIQQIDFASALVLMSLAAVVQSVPRWWTAIRWAQAKYAYALDDITGLRLHPAMRELEKHQKSVLSDEWGIGVALEWLTSVFQYRAVCHGAVAVRQLRRMNLLKGYPVWKRIGPEKCPDFVAIDPQHKFHIIECKGSTKGRSAIRKAFDSAYEQKHSIRFKSDGAFVSQRLSVGLAIATNRVVAPTTLYVEDPDEKRLPSSRGAYVVKDDATAEQIEQAIFTSMMIEHSALAGAFDVLAAASAAYGPVDQGDVQELPTEMIKFEADGAVWVGQRFQALAPIALMRDHRQSTIVIRSGMSPLIHDSLIVPRAWREHEDLVGAASPDLKLAPFKRTKIDEAGLRCSIQFGDAFISDLSITDSRLAR